MVQLICCACFNSFKFASALSIIDIFLCVLAFILSFVFRDNDLRDPIGLIVSLSIFIFLLIDILMELYGINFKNFCVVAATFVTRSALISVANLAVIILPFYFQNLGIAL